MHHIYHFLLIIDISDAILFQISLFLLFGYIIGLVILYSKDISVHRLWPTLALSGIYFGLAKLLTLANYLGARNSDFPSILDLLMALVCYSVVICIGVLFSLGLIVWQIILLWPRKKD